MPVVTRQVTPPIIESSRCNSKSSGMLIRSDLERLIIGFCNRLFQNRRWWMVGRSIHFINSFEGFSAMLQPSQTLEKLPRRGRSLRDCGSFQIDQAEINWPIKKFQGIRPVSNHSFMARTTSRSDEHNKLTDSIEAKSPVTLNSLFKWINFSDNVSSR